VLESAAAATDLDPISYLKASPDARMRRGVRIYAWYQYQATSMTEPAPTPKVSHPRRRLWHQSRSCSALVGPGQFGDQLEEQVPRRWFERQVAQFIDDQQFRLGILRQPHLQRPLLLRLDRGAEQFHRRGELRRVATGHRLTAQQHYVVAIGDPAAGAQITDLARID